MSTAGADPPQSPEPTAPDDEEEVEAITLLGSEEPEALQAAAALAAGEPRPAPVPVPARVPDPVVDDGAASTVVDDGAASTVVDAERESLAERLERELRKSRAIEEIARALGSTLDLDELLALIMERVTALMRADRSTLYLLDEQSGELWSSITQGDAVREIRLSVGEGVAGWVAKTGLPLNIPDVYADARFSREVDERSGYRTHSVLCMPLLNNRGRILGVIQVLNKRGGAFEQEDEQLLGALAGHAAVALENAQLLRTLMAKNRELLLITRRLERKMAELDLLFEIEAELGRAREVPSVLDGMIDRAVDRLGAEAGCVFLISGSGSSATAAVGEIYLRGGAVAQSDAGRRHRAHVGEGILGWVAKEGQPALVRDVEKDPRNAGLPMRKLGVAARNLVAVPLRAEGKLLGAAALINKAGDRPFTDDDLQVLTLIGGQTAKALLLVEAHERQLREERLSTIGQMLSSLLHDLRTPMTVASGYAQIMVETESREERSEYSNMILRQFEIMSSMAREVLAFARGEQNLLVRRVLLHQFLGEMKGQIEQDFAGKDIQLLLEDGYRGVAYFDEQKLRRVFANIARNAAEAMPTGGRFTVAVQKIGEDLMLSFSDTGKGIPQELEGRLFETFASAGKAGGTGLGLAIVKKIVEDHGGAINYVSRVGEGTTFVIALPRACSRGTPVRGVSVRSS